jgi:riboflavin synthase
MMFTGLVEATGTIRELTPVSGGAKIGIEAPSLPAADLSTGESVAVDGVCLTVTRVSGRRFHADVVRETLSCTTLGRARPGHRVNLERSLQVGDRLGGHLVQGHVDAVARVVRLSRAGADVRLRVALAPEISPFVATKGSIALNGVSLTVAGLSGDAFEVALIPETLSRTNLGTIRAGDVLNVEVDLLARYLERLMHRERSVVPAPPGAERQEWE